MRAQQPLKFRVRGFARRGAATLGRIVVGMTRHEIEPESRWIRLARAMGPGLYAISVFAGMPPHRTAMLSPYRSSDGPARRERQQSEGVTR